MDAPPHITRLTVTDSHAGVRIDAFVSAQLHWRSRRWLVDLLGRGGVRVDGRRVKKAYRLVPGSVVELELPATEIPHEDIAAVPLDVLFEDDDIVVVNKPAGVAVHAASTCPYVHLQARLALHYAVDANIDARDPGIDATPSIIHRLDRGTSGVIAYARRRSRVAHYAGQFERRTVRKAYVAIVHGQPPDTGTIEHPLQVIDCQPVRVAPEGKPSKTSYRVVDRQPHAAMARIALHTGRKHQIRVHFAADGYPLVYDNLYGRIEEREAWPDDARPMLHAARLEIEHRTRGPMVFEAPIPQAMLDTWSALDGGAAVPPIGKR